jgi:hypothetical protein
MNADDGHCPILAPISHEAYNTVMNFGKFNKNGDNFSRNGDGDHRMYYIRRVSPSTVMFYILLVAIILVAGGCCIFGEDVLVLLFG